VRSKRSKKQGDRNKQGKIESLEFRIENVEFQAGGKSGRGKPAVK